MFRIGHGYDVHKLKKGLAFTLGGVKIEHTKGFVAHSDGDVLLHAVMDALLGAMALGDIGKHFPDTDMRYKGINSMELFKNVWDMAKERGYSLNNIDITIIAQKPKIAPHIEEMKANLSLIMRARLDEINIKATTEEGLGFTGSEEGVAVHCVVMLVKK